MDDDGPVFQAGSSTGKDVAENMRQWRASLWEAPIPKIAQRWSRTRQKLQTAEAWELKVPGYKRGCGETLLRELIAMVFIKLVLWSNEAHVYGGYVREFVSGKEWNDIDVCFSTSLDIQKFKEMLGTMLRTLMDHPFHLKLRNIGHSGLPSHASLYAYEVHHHDLMFRVHEREISVQVDITTRRNSRDMGHRMPASYGSCLKLNMHGVTLMTNAQQKWIGGYTLAEICEALRSHRDIARLPEYKEWSNHHSASSLAQYHVNKTLHLQRMGYEVVPGTGLSLQEYDAVISSESRQLGRRLEPG